MPKFVTASVLVVLATALCGFSDNVVDFGLGVYRGEPLQEAIARFGKPVEVAHLEGRKIYYWRVNRIMNTCKVWGAAEKGIIVNWGYQSCAF
jgi:hypothetical protein